MIKAAAGWQTNVDGRKGSYKGVFFACNKNIILRFKYNTVLDQSLALVDAKETPLCVFAINACDNRFPLCNITRLTL